MLKKSTLLNHGMEVVGFRQGARQVRRLMPDAVSLFIIPPSKKALHERLVKRNMDDESVIKKRMNQAMNEMSHYNESDFLIIPSPIQNDCRRVLSNLLRLLEPCSAPVW
jgi:guanylate kinase